MPDFDEEQLAKAIGKAISRQRRSCQLTQEEVAERLGVGNEAVSRMERGIVIPTVTRLVQLASVFRCETADLLVQASGHSGDQASYLERLLTQLSSGDRQIIVEIVEKLAIRLARKK